ncbi:MAG: HAMP domain-containing protein, partial [Planctomycetes bacterium]|nr:HAMP domain-containing protein [Planctomycetota bacterium]
VLRPVEKVIHATQRVAEGDLDFSIEFKANDEIGKLAESFNDMIHRLSDVQRQLFQVAHEINNPLTGVLTYSSFLLKRTKEYPDVQEDLTVIVRETKRCREIVKGLLDYSRQSIQAKRHVQVNEIVNDTAKILHNQLSGRHIKFTMNLGIDIPLVLVDKNQIEQVLVNLLINAVDAVPEENALIIVETALVHEESGKMPTVMIKVSDNGCGISPDDMTRVFDPFFSTKGPRGNGLGLAIAWSIIDKHNGRIDLNSEIGKGTTFTIVLPAEEEKGQIEN